MWINRASHETLSEKKKEYYKKDKKNKAMVAKWSDSEESSESIMRMDKRICVLWLIVISRTRKKTTLKRY